MLASGFELDLIRNSWRLQRNYNWDIFLPDMGVSSGMDIGRYCQEISFGDYTMNEVVTQRYGAYQSKFAGLMGIEDVTFTFLKPVPDIVSAYFYYWRSLIVNLAGFYNVKSQYAKTVKVFMYDTNGAISNTITLIGVFPKTVPVYRMSYGDENMVQMSITCSVDRFSVGDYIPPYFPTQVEQPVTNSDYAVVIGNDLPQQNKEATNAHTVGNYQASRAFATIPSKVGSALPIPAPDLGWIGGKVPTITIGTPSLPDGIKVSTQVANYYPVPSVREGAAALVSKYSVPASTYQFGSSGAQAVARSGAAFSGNLFQSGSFPILSFAPAIRL